MPTHGIKHTLTVSKTCSAEGEIHHFGRCRHFLARSRLGKEGGWGEPGRAAVAPPVRHEGLPGPGEAGSRRQQRPHGASAAGMPVGAGRRPPLPQPPRCSRGMLPAPRSSPAPTRTGPVDAGGKTPPAATEAETLAGEFCVATPPRLAVRALTAFGQPRPRGAPPPARSPLLSPLRRRETKTTQKRHGGHRHPPAGAAPRREAGGGAALPLARRGRPSPPGGGGGEGGGRLEAGPRGAVAPVGARRAAGSLLLQLPRKAGIREPGRV